MGTVRQDRNKRWYIEFPGSVIGRSERLRIYVNKQHENFHSLEEAKL
jgi:hypothetical protein